MNRQTKKLIAVSLWLALAYTLSRRYYPDIAAPIEEAASGAVEYIQEVVMGPWWTVANRPENLEYVGVMHDTEIENGIPENMLVALAYQESRFRPDIISGATRSSAGATGIMQIVPKWHPDVNPLDAAASIRYAGKFLRSLYNKFGSWEQALQAYNWGPGNLTQFQKGNIPFMPIETRNYSSQILARLEEFEGGSVA